MEIDLSITSDQSCEIYGKEHCSVASVYEFDWDERTKGHTYQCEECIKDRAIYS